MKLGHYLFGLVCFVAAGLLAVDQGVEAYRTGYRVEVLIHHRARLQEARQRLLVALSALERPDRLKEKAASLRLPLVEPEVVPPEGGDLPEDP